MTLEQGLVITFVVLAGAMLLTSSHGVRMTLLLILIALSVLTLLGGGMRYVLGLFG